MVIKNQIIGNQHNLHRTTYHGGKKKKQSILGNDSSLLTAEILKENKSVGFFMIETENLQNSSKAYLF